MRRHIQGGMVGAQARGEIIRNPRRGAEQKEAKVPARTKRGQRRDEVDARDRLPHIAALTPSCPDDADAIRQTQIRRLEYSSELTIR
jgi:hypothetical protein